MQPQSNLTMLASDPAQSTQVEYASDLKDMETRLMLEAILKCHGFDFRDYERKFLQDRIECALKEEGTPTISALQDKLLHDAPAFDRFLTRFSTPPLGMFDDPDFFKVFRRKLIPFLRTYPSVRIWCAGCGMGQEVYSLAILLREEQLESRVTIYATETNEVVLRKAEEGRFLQLEVAKWKDNYKSSGGIRLLSSYYTLDGSDSVFDASLKRRICFSQHNPITDGSFNEFHIILCRNYLNQLGSVLEERVMKLFRESLITFGYLCLGKDEKPGTTHSSHYFQKLEEQTNIYRKIP